MCVLAWAGGRSRGGPFPKMWLLLNRVEAEFSGATRKERPCFAAECGLDRLGHTSLRMVYWGHTKRTALFCCSKTAPFLSCGPNKVPGSFLPEAGQSRILQQNSAVLFLQNVAPTPSGTHEHSRVHFLIPVLAVYVLGLVIIICRIIIASTGV